jgi:Fusaric acid resistance protein-like
MEGTSAPPLLLLPLNSRTVSTSSTIPTPASNPAHFLADVYTFKWSALNYRLPLVSAGAVALCLVVGILAGHPGGALVSAGGALTIGFGANQRISDSRLLPMLFAVFGMASATLVGTLAGHDGFSLILASACSAMIYGVLAVRHAGLAWVGQQASVALFVASAFPTGPHRAFERAGLIVIGGIVQVVITSAGLRLMPELRKDLWTISRSLYTSLYEQRRELLNRLYTLPAALPAPDRKTAAIYALRLVLTVSLASEVYRRLGIQSGYWIPMTALLVQKPAFYETLSRALARVGGTLAGATLATVLASHVHPGVWPLAALTTFFAFWCFATNAVNYGLFSLCITSYIVFLLSLNQIPGPELAHRRAACTAAGAVIALLIHLDALGRHAKAPTQT